MSDLLRAARTAALALPVALLAACSGDGAPAVVEADGTYLLLAAPSDGVMEARAVGTLTRGEDGCLYLDADEQHTLLVWPAGTTLDHDETAVTVPDGAPLQPWATTTLVIGSDVEVGGGGVDVPADSPTSVVPEVPDACDTADVFLVGRP